MDDSYGGGGGGGGYDGGEIPIWMRNPPPPTPPAFSFGFGTSPPPPPPPAEHELTKHLMADLSMGIASLMGLGFCICAYCFFREDLLSVASKASGGKVGGRKGGRGPKYGVVGPQGAERIGEEQRPGKKGKKGGKGGKGGARQGVAEGYARVKIETKALSQKKEVWAAPNGLPPHSHAHTAP